MCSGTFLILALRFTPVPMGNPIVGPRLEDAGPPGFHSPQRTVERNLQAWSPLGGQQRPDNPPVQNNAWINLRLRSVVILTILLGVIILLQGCQSVQAPAGGTFLTALHIFAVIATRAFSTSPVVESEGYPAGFIPQIPHAIVVTTLVIIITIGWYFTKCSSKSVAVTAKPDRDKLDHLTTYGDAIYCQYCEMWLNGPAQWSDHQTGRKHRKAEKSFLLRD